MFDSLTMHGGTASLAWGYRPAGTIRAWRVTKKRGDDQWRLAATLDRVDAFTVRQAVARKELLFTAPRAGGFWCWPVLSIDLTATQLSARLGPPEY